MAFVDDPNSGQQSQQVAGSTPLSTGGEPTAQESSGSSTGGSGVSTAPSSGTPSQAPRTANKGSGKASSGMYTNIQKYVDKNRPQAQQMAGAVTQNVESQAQNINQAVQQKKQEQQQLIDTNRQMMEAQQQEASGLINQAMSGGELGQTEQQRFQALMQGPTGVQQVGNLNLAQQENKANALQQLAASGRTEQGRRNMLKDTFQPQGAYTQGMSGLDQLILSGDAGAREAIVQGTAGTADQLMGQLAQTRQQAQEQAAQMGTDINQFGQQIGEMGTGALGGVNTQIDEAYQQELANRAALFGTDSPEYQQALAAAQGRLDQLGGVVGDLGSFAKYAQQYATNRKWDDSGVNDYLDQMQEFQNTGNVTVSYINDNGYRDTKTLSGQEAQDFLQQGGNLDTTHHKEREEIRGIVDAINKNLIGTDELGLYGLENQLVSSGSGYTPTKTAFQKGNIYNTFQNLQNQLQGLGSAEDIIRRRIEQEAGGQSFEDVVSGADLQRLDIASQEDINRINALKGLLGQEDILTQEQYGDQAYTGLDKLQNILKAYGG